MLDVRYSHLYFYQSLNRLQRGLSAIAELLVKIIFERIFTSPPLTITSLHKLKDLPTLLLNPAMTPNPNPK